MISANMGCILSHRRTKTYQGSSLTGKVTPQPLLNQSVELVLWHPRGFPAHHLAEMRAEIFPHLVSILVRASDAQAGNDAAFRQGLRHSRATVRGDAGGRDGVAARIVPEREPTRWARLLAGSGLQPKLETHPAEDVAAGQDGRIAVPVRARNVVGRLELRLEANGADQPPGSGVLALGLEGLVGAGAVVVQLPGSGAVVGGVV